MNYKIFRIGHRNFKNGVITIASVINREEGKLWYGTSFCSPKETKYYKRLGNDLAIKDLEEKIKIDRFIPLPIMIIHKNIVSEIVKHLCTLETNPSWVLELLIKQLEYPIDLLRYNNKKMNEILNIGITEIVVKSELAKEQLLSSIQYLDRLSNIDREFVAVDDLLHVWLNPSLIRVK